MLLTQARSRRGGIKVARVAHRLGSDVAATDRWRDWETAAESRGVSIERAAQRREQRPQYGDFEMSIEFVKRAAPDPAHRGYRRDPREAVFMFAFMDAVRPYAAPWSAFGPLDFSRGWVACSRPKRT